MLILLYKLVVQEIGLPHIGVQYLMMPQYGSDNVYVKQGGDIMKITKIEVSNPVLGILSRLRAAAFTRMKGFMAMGKPRLTQVQEQKPDLPRLWTMLLC